MPRYRAIPRAARVADLRSAQPAVEAPAPEPEVSYRDLQEQAKAAGIPANQNREELEAALAEAADG